jgi:hypothetical protein
LSGEREIDFAIAARSTSAEIRLVADSATMARSKRRCSRNGSDEASSASSSSRRRGGAINFTPSSGISYSNNFDRRNAAPLGNGVATATVSLFFSDASLTSLNHGNRTLSQVPVKEEPMCNETDCFGRSGSLGGIR